MWNSYIFKKFLVALTGAFLCFFLLIHVMGSSLILAGPYAFNHYSHFLAESKLTILIELALLVSFLVHAGVSGWLSAVNRRSRDRGYAVAANGAKRTGLASSTMIWQGALLLAFVLFHLVTLKWGPRYTVVYDGVVMRDLYRVAIDSFRNPLVVVFYCASVAVLGVHLARGIPSFLQSLGLARVSDPRLSRFGQGFAILVAGGFMIQPICAYLLLGGLR